MSDFIPINPIQNTKVALYDCNDTHNNEVYVLDNVSCNKTYKIIIHDRNYTHHTIYDTSTLTDQKHIDIDPIKYKMFSGDVLI